MNPSEASNAVRWACAVLGTAVARWGVTADQWGAITSDLVTMAPVVASAAWGIYAHWNMKKVPEKAVVVTNP